ncbi:DUF411 domain-containing protein [Salinimonas sp. HHU 13199]|uniref:DUF411 domain-containing protein n=1 Tax=Salinimonas profundi TaxID=2729140 RepID=A0ABR8LKY8_9ALTE|nr:DUF411 domain-containing protein [Salinimonas profundi]MBD3584734.1 DUF411 domain-containing protein [Salinimonas profundi]
MILRILAVIVSLLSIGAHASTEPETVQFDVFKSASCGCCKGWIAHLENSQRGKSSKDTWHIEGKDTNALSEVKANYNIPAQYQSCHTAVTRSGYVFEGHIPARYIQSFLKNPPEDAFGLAVPGMPVGSPGMESGLRFQPYTIQLLLKDGTSRPFATVSKFEEQY